MSKHHRRIHYGAYVTDPDGKVALFACSFSPAVLENRIAQEREHDMAAKIGHLISYEVRETLDCFE